MQKMLKRMLHENHLNSMVFKRIHIHSVVMTMDRFPWKLCAHDWEGSATRVQRYGNHERHATYAGPDGSWAHFQQQMVQFTFGWHV